jgi:uncharacterized Zn finger protein
VGHFFNDLGNVWAEALLSAQLASSERAQWVKQLSAWQTEVENFGIDESFGAAILAAEEGLDSPYMKQTLQGIIPDEEPFHYYSWYASELITAQLNVLEYQQRYQEFLNLAAAHGKIARYLSMLVSLGKISEAVSIAKESLRSAKDTLSFAKSLLEVGETKEALSISEQGLSLQGDLHMLATWVKTIALQEQKPQLALKAAIVEFKESPTKNTYLLIEELSEEKWSKIKQELLSQLVNHDIWLNPSEEVGIYLLEGMVAEAIQVVEKNNPPYDVIHKVVSAAISNYPNWAIGESRRQAESILNAGASKHYVHAANWLRKTKAAYLSSGKDAEWNSYLTELMDKHKKKYKLIPLLQGLE